jgi:5'-nucleotidase
VLQAFNPHIFFDDQDVHVEAASGQVPTGKVLYRSDSTLRELQEERAEENGQEVSA